MNSKYNVKRLFRLHFVKSDINSQHEPDQDERKERWARVDATIEYIFDENSNCDADNALLDYLYETTARDFGTERGSFSGAINNSTNAWYDYSMLKIFYTVL